MAGRAVHDPAAPPAHRRGARHAALPRGHGLRGCPDRRRARRQLRLARLPRPRTRRLVHPLPERQSLRPLARNSQARLRSRAAAPAKGRQHPRRLHARVPRRRLHHRRAGCGDHVCGRGLLVAGRDARHPFLRIGTHSSSLPSHIADQRYVPLRSLECVRSPDGSGCGCGLRPHHVGPHVAHDLQCADPGPQEGRGKARGGAVFTHRSTICLPASSSAAADC